MNEPEKPKRERGSGSIYRNRGCSIYWIKVYSNGVARRESSQSSDLKVAEKLLRRRLGEIAADRYVPPAAVRVGELVADVIGDYEMNGRKSLAQLRRRWEIHLKPWFEKRKASEVSTATVRRYIDSRVDQKAEPATINRELALLRRAFNLARKASPPKITVVPYIPLFRERNARIGFLEPQQEARLTDECARVGLWLRTAFEIGLTFGWRLSEVCKLRVRQVNLLQRTLSLDVGTTKNDQGRTVRITETLATLFAQCTRGKQPNDYLLTREDGRPLGDFRKAWHGVCCRAGLGRMVCPNIECRNDEGKPVPVEKKRCPNCGRKWKYRDLRYAGLLFHDLRRSMARNMRNSGVAEEVIMRVGGWKTSSVFKRYSIVNPNDVAEAVLRVDAARKRDREAAAQSESLGNISGKIAPSSRQSDDPELALPLTPVVRN